MCASHRHHAPHRLATETQQLHRSARQRYGMRERTLTGFRREARRVLHATVRWRVAVMSWRPVLGERCSRSAWHARAQGPPGGTPGGPCVTSDATPPTARSTAARVSQRGPGSRAMQSPTTWSHAASHGWRSHGSEGPCRAGPLASPTSSGIARLPMGAAIPLLVGGESLPWSAAASSRARWLGRCVL